MRDWASYLRANLDLPAMRGQRDERALRELADHLEDVVADALAHGRSEEEAEASALAWLGDPGRAAAELRAAEPGRLRAEAARRLEHEEHVLRQRGGARRVLADRLRDLRTGARSLARQPLFAGVVVLVLALGIGATTAIFTLLHTVVLSPLPFDAPGRLVAIRHSVPAQGIQAGQCAAWHFTYEDENRVFESLGMFGGGRAAVTGHGDPDAVPTLDVTQGVLPTLRLTPVVGRVFAPADHDPDGARTIMLSYGYWRSRFGADPGVVGTTLTVDGTPREIIGVAPPELKTLNHALSRDPAIIRPLRFRRADLFVGNIGYGAVARLKEGVTPAQARADLERMLPMAWEKFPGGPVADSSRPSDHRVELRPLADDLVGPASRLLWILFGGVATVLLIAVANVTNLMLVHFEGKRGELAVRVALGASRGRIVWEHVKDTLPLAVLGGTLGLGLGQLGLRALLALGGVNLPRVDEVALGPVVVLATAALSLAIGLLLGWLPARHACRLDPSAALREGGRSNMRDRAGQRTRNLLAVGQVAMVLVLLAAAGLLLRSYRALTSIDPGFGEPGDVLVVRTSIPHTVTQDGAELAVMWEAITRRLAQVPGVRAAALASSIPMDRNGNVNPLYVEGRTHEPGANGTTRRHKWIAADYLQTMQTTLVAGRPITWDDVHARAPVAMLSARLARELFGSPEAALGKRIAARPDPPRWKEVVGVVADVLEDGLGEEAPALVYWPFVTLGFWQGDPPDDVQLWRGNAVALRSDQAGSPAFLDAVRRAVWEVNPNLPVTARMLPDLMAATTARTVFAATLLNVAAGVGLILGCVGVFGVVSYSVARRTGELGMRIVLGADPWRLRGMVLRQGLGLAAAGVAIGLAAAVAVTRPMASMLFGVSPSDPPTYAIVAVSLLAVAALASYLPAARASKVDPIVALRAQ